MWKFVTGGKFATAIADVQHEEMIWCLVFLQQCWHCLWERLYSYEIDQIQSKDHRLLKEAQLSNCLTIKLEGSSIKDFNPDKAINLWFQKASRRPGTIKTALSFSGKQEWSCWPNTKRDLQVNRWQWRVYCGETEINHKVMWKPWSSFWRHNPRTDQVHIHWCGLTKRKNCMVMVMT